MEPAMKSRAHFRSHPIHPALIPFPLAFLLGAFGFDVAGVITKHTAFWMTGSYLAVAGVIAALLAAVPGFIDYFTVVPPQSTGKRRATRHMMLNLSAVVLFASARFLRGSPATAPDPVLIGLEGIGAVLLIIAGWMGGVLVSRNQISVDHRYAGAGKWREESTSSKEGVARVGRVDELAVDQMKLVHVDGKRITLARTEAGFVAFDDRCTHRGGSLADGVSICGTVQCPWHGSQFDMRTGAVKAGPAKVGIRAYVVEQRGQDLFIKL
jgi:uncharacterized membrane protein/nitrite reductase/ring-hydroxylating ferredoxin subunit